MSKLRRDKGISIIALLIIILILLSIIAFGIKFALDGKIFDYARKSKFKSSYTSYTLEENKLKGEY